MCSIFLALFMGKQINDFRQADFAATFLTRQVILEVDIEP